MVVQSQISGSLRILTPLYGTCLLFALSIFLIFIPQQEQQLLNQKKETTRQLTDNVLNFLRDIDDKIKKGELSPDLARKRAADHIRNLRYGPEGKDYFWIIDMHGSMIVHPFRPDLEGKKVTRFKDTQGNHPFADMVKIVAQNNAGYVNYRWQWKDDPGRMAVKTAYVKGFPAWGWIVGTGIYLDDIHEEISAVTRNFVQMFVGILLFIVLLSLYITRHVLRIEQRKNQAETARDLDELRLKKLLELSRMTDRPTSELKEFALEQAIQLTRSDIGYLAFLNEDESLLTMHTWSKKTMKECEIADKRLIYAVEHAGLWAEAARTRKTQIINDYENYSSERKKGIPRGHVPITRVLNVPVFDGSTLVVLAGVGNKNDHYDDSDVRQLKLLMDGMYKILQRKKAEDDLRESERRYRFLADNATDTIWILALSDFSFSYVTPSIKQLLGYSPEQYKAMNMGANMTREGVELVHSIISEELKQDDRDSFDAGRQRQIEAQVRKKDGTWIWVEVSARFLRDENGTPDRILGITRDISQRKALEQQLLQTNADLRLAQQLASIGNWSLAPDQEVPFWSDELYRIFERDPSLGPLPIAEHQAVFTGKWRTLFETAIKEALERGIGFDHENKMALPSGQVKWIHAICEPEWVASGQHYILRGTVQDITQRKTMESRIQQAQKMEALGTLAGGIAHDFNNILSSIIGFTELAKLGAAENKPLKNNLDTVLTAGLRARELVKHILTFSRKADVQNDIIQIVPLINESLKFLRASTPANIDIHTRFMVTDASILADQTQIHQVLMNLFSNATHAMKERGGVLAVVLDDFDLGAENRLEFPRLKPGSYVRLSISDTGTGIEKHVIERIFEPFFTTKVRGEGTGMGLSLAYGIIKAMKGHISVSSEPGMGTKFQVLVPKQENGFAPASEELPPAELSKGNGKILLIDDEPTIIGWTSNALSQMGYQVVGMTSPVEAVEAVKNDPENFDLVITDLTMPGMTGLELSSVVMAERPGIPIILCTGFSEGLSPDRMKRHGISRVLMKPMIVDELCKAIAEILAGTRLRE